MLKVVMNNQKLTQQKEMLQKREMLQKKVEIIQVKTWMTSEKVKMKQKHRQMMV